jgi:hypothetical protein
VTAIGRLFDPTSSAMKRDFAKPPSRGIVSVPFLIQGLPPCSIDAADHRAPPRSPRSTPNI